MEYVSSWIERHARVLNPSEVSKQYFGPFEMTGVQLAMATESEEPQVRGWGLSIPGRPGGSSLDLAYSHALSRLILKHSDGHELSACALHRDAATAMEKVYCRALSLDILLCHLRSSTAAPSVLRTIKEQFKDPDFHSAANKLAESFESFDILRLSPLSDDMAIVVAKIGQGRRVSIGLGASTNLVAAAMQALGEAVFIGISSPKEFSPVSFERWVYLLGYHGYLDSLTHGASREVLSVDSGQKGYSQMLRAGQGKLPGQLGDMPAKMIYADSDYVYHPLRSKDEKETVNLQRVERFCADGPSFENIGIEPSLEELELTHASMS